MRKIIGILVCLWISVGLWAFDYQPATFGSTSAYLSGGRAADFGASSAMRPSGAMAYTSGVSMSGSMSAISASNFETLNSEGGACYNPARDGSAIRRVGRPGSGSGGTGVSDPQSPVGDTPWIIMALLGILYLIRSKKRKKVKKNLVVL